MPATLNNQRIRDIFTESIAQVRIGKKPVISKMMREKGYSPSSCRALKITQTKTWEDLLAEIDDGMLIRELRGLALEKKDKRAKLQAIDMLLKLKSKYPVTKEIRELIDKRESIIEP